MAYHEIERLISRLRYLINTSEKVVSKFTEEEMSFKGGRNNHSKKETLGNLITSAMMNQVRFNKILADEELAIIEPINYDTNAIYDRYNKQSSKQLLKLWVNLNEQIIYTLEDVSVHKLAKKVIDSSKQEEITFLWIVKDYIDWLYHKLDRLYKTHIISKSSKLDKISLDTVLEKLNSKTKLPFIKVFEKKKFILELYKPDKIDNQSPHKQDEIYIIISGQGKFLKGNELFDFKAQDVFFVKSGVHHKFIDFTDDFKTWVLFF